MASDPIHRKVLVLKEELAIQRLFIFVKRVEKEASPDGNRASPLAEVNRRHFEEVVVDLRCTRKRSQNEVRGVGEIRPSLMGKTLVISIQVNGPETLGLVERYLLNRLPPALLWLVCHRY